MGFVVFLLTAILSGAIFENGGAALFLGFLCYILYRQNKRISYLEKSLVRSETKLEVETKASIPEAKPQKEEIKSAQQVSPQVPPQEVTSSTAISHRENQIKRPVKAPPPPRSLSQIFEGFFGPTITHFIFQGNPIARIGAVVLLIGIVFLLKLAAEQGLFPPELRLIGSSLLSIVLLIIGWRLKDSRKQFSVTLQGTGAGIFYISAYLAYSLYGLIPGPLAFAFLVGITFISGWLSLLQDSKSLAIIGLIGGFLAPLLTSDGSGSHIALFSYLAILNLGVFGLCWFKAWRGINLTAFLFTFIIACAWGEGFYVQDFYLSCQIFLIFFAALYAVTNALYSINENKAGTNVIDSLMTFLAPILVFSLQWPLVKNIEYGTAISSALYGAFYVICARILFSKYGNNLRFLVESYLLIGLILISLAVPFAFDSQISSAIWALEASALVWSGIRQSRFALRGLGLVVLVGSAILFLNNPVALYDDLSFRNSYFLGIFLLTVGHIISGALLIKGSSASQTEKDIAPYILLISVFWWAFGAGYETTRHMNVWFESLQGSISTEPAILFFETFSISVLSLFGSISIATFWAVWKRWELPGRKLIRQCMIPFHVALIAWFFIQLGSNSIYAPGAHLLSIFGIISWPVFFILHYTILSKEEKGEGATSNPAQHAWAFWLLITVVTWEAGWVLKYVLRTADEWRQAAWIAIPAFYVISTLIRTKLQQKKWPLLQNTQTYLNALWLPLWWALLLSFVLDFISPAYSYPLPYIPLINPLDVAQAISFIAALIWLKRSETNSQSLKGGHNLLIWSIGPWLFVWATSTLIRILHHFFRVGWRRDIIFESQLVQASLSIFWSVLALTLMLLAHRKRWRVIWQAGAVLIGIVVIKLFVVDLSSQGTVARIAAFVGVGLLMLLIGYLAPIPPDENQKEEIK